MLGQAAVLPVPEAASGMQRRKRQARCDHISSKSCCGNVGSGTQTDASLPHILREVLWTASCFVPVAGFEEGNKSVVIEAATNSPSILDVDFM